MENVGLETCETHNLKTSPLTSEGSESSSTFQDGEIAPLTSSNGKMVLLQTKNSKRGSTSLRCKDEDIVSTNAPDESVESLAVIPVRLSETLKRHLEEDYVHVTKKRRLIRVPAEPNAISVLEDFVRHYAAARMVSYEKQRSKTFYTSNRREEDKLYFDKAIDSVNIAKEVAEGVRILLDFNLDKILLYGDSGEQEQYKRIMNTSGGRTNISMQISDKCHPNSISPNLEKARHSQINSNENLADEIKENIMVEGPKLYTLTGNTQQNPNLLSMAALRERRKVNLSIDSRTTSSLETENGALRIPSQSGGGSSKDSTTSGRSSTTPTHSLLTPPATSPTTPQATQLMRSIHQWKLVPAIVLSGSNEASQHSKHEKSSQKCNFGVIPSSMYGPIHLLRLFVKIPEILGRMKMPPKRSKLILKYLDSLLEYLESQPNLFNTESVYE